MSEDVFRLILEGSKGLPYTRLPLDSRILVHEILIKIQMKLLFWIMEHNDLKIPDEQEFKEIVQSALKESLGEKYAETIKEFLKDQ
jgi:hypothetical protein